jgi:Protein kinase domain
VSPESPQGALVGQLLGGYRLTSLLGAGGMAEVYRAQEPRLGREVAIKVLPPHLAQDAGYVNRFRFEAQRVAALTHPNVVPVYNYGEERGLLYIVMPLMRESLRDRMEREHTIDPSEAARLAVQVAAALDAAHQQGIVHRDVKPENILLNAEGRAMLTDFGIARELDVLREANQARTLAATGLPVGTPEYMAPEQLRGVSADQRVDVYGLGAVLYEMLTGHVPHDADTPYEVAARVLTERALPPSEYNPAIWPDLEEVVLGALTIDPDDRYPDMRTFAGALRRAVLQRGAGTALVAADAVSLAPTPLARSIATGRMAPVTGTLAPVSSWGVPGAYSSYTGASRPRKRSKRTIVLVAVGALLALAVCGSGTLFMFNAFAGLGFSPDGRSSLPFAAATATDASAEATTIAAVATDTATAWATATAASVAATATAQPTATAVWVPQPTATPVPRPSLTVSPTNTFSVAGPGCKSSKITITNAHGGSNLTWTWNWSPPTPGGGHWWYQLNGSWGNSQPKNVPGSSPATVVLSYVGGTCGTGSKPYTVTLSASDGTTTTLTIKF